MKWKELIAPSESDKGAVEMSYPNVYSKKNRGIGAKTKVRKETAIRRNSRTGQIYGRKTIYQKAT
jgi:hypothetical protein